MCRKLIFKTITYRILGCTFTVTASYLITDNIDIAASLGVVELVGKSVLYYLHEFIYAKIN